jgi:hypothetical protein
MTVAILAGKEPGVDACVKVEETMKAAEQEQDREYYVHIIHYFFIVAVVHTLCANRKFILYSCCDGPACLLCTVGWRWL